MLEPQSPARLELSTFMQNSILFEKEKPKDSKELWNDAVAIVCRLSTDYNDVIAKKEKLNRVKTWETKKCIYKEYTFKVNGFECILQYWKPLIPDSVEKAQYSLWDNRNNRYFKRTITS